MLIGKRDAKVPIVIGPDASRHARRGNPGYQVSQPVEEVAAAPLRADRDLERRSVGRHRHLCGLRQLHRSAGLSLPVVAGQPRGVFRIVHVQQVHARRRWTIVGFRARGRDRRDGAVRETGRHQAGDDQDGQDRRSRDSEPLEVVRRPRVCVDSFDQVAPQSRDWRVRRLLLLKCRSDLGAQLFHQSISSPGRSFLAAR